MTLSELNRLRDIVRSTFTYNPETGEFRRVVNRSKYERRTTGSRTVRKSGKTYILVKVGSKTYLAHRIIYLYMTGNFPDGEVDHVDGDGTNNRWNNMRAGTRRDNCLNVRRKVNNTSGFTGVSFCKAKKRWQAYISSDSGRVHLGFYENLEDAVKVRLAAAEKFGYKEGHGSDRPL